MKINRTGFERLALTSGRTEIVITPDRENKNMWFVDYTTRRGQIRPNRVTLTTTELKAAVGITDMRVKKIGEYMPDKFFRDENIVVIPPRKGGARITIDSKVRDAVRHLLTTSNHRVLN